MSTNLQTPNYERLPFLQEKNIIVAGSYGAGGEMAGDNPTLKTLVANLNGQMFHSFQEKKIVNFLCKGAEQDKKIVLIGYSRGGNTAVRIANMLGKKNINVFQLIAFDPHSLMDKKTFELKYNNVGKAYNFFQRNPRTAGRLGWWGINPYWGSPVISRHIEVNQMDFTGVNCVNNMPVSHLNIIQHSLNFL